MIIAIRLYEGLLTTDIERDFMIKENIHEYLPPKSSTVRAQTVNQQGQKVATCLLKQLLPQDRRAVIQSNPQAIVSVSL